MSQDKIPFNDNLQGLFVSKQCIHHLHSQTSIKLNSYHLTHEFHATKPIIRSIHLTNSGDSLIKHYQGDISFLYEERKREKKKRIFSTIEIKVYTERTQQKNVWRRSLHIN